MWDFLADLPPGILYVSFTFTAATELYFFLVQRSALEIARIGSLDARTSRYMLPLWFALHWPIQVVKWLLLFLILLAAGWIPAVICLAVPFLLSLVVPIPHQYFIPMFRHRISRDLITGENVEIATNLQAALDLAVKSLEMDKELCEAVPNTSSRRAASMPWPSMVALLYPISATIYIAGWTPASPTIVAGYGLANLGYLLFGAGIWAGSFQIFGLNKRWQVFTAALVFFLVGTVLSNVRE